MSEKLDRFVKFIESGGIITDVTLYNCLYAEIEKDLENAEKCNYYHGNVAMECSIESNNDELKNRIIKDYDKSIDAIELADKFTKIYEELTDET